jgi:hypothetical protein
MPLSTIFQLYRGSQKIKVITKLPNSEQSYKGKVKTHNYINRQNQSTKHHKPVLIYAANIIFLVMTY